MTELKFKELEKVRKVDYGDFEDFIKEIYGQEFSYVANEECSNEKTYFVNSSISIPI